MSKKIVLLIVMVMCLFALTGCLDSKNDKPTTASGEKKIIHMGVAGPFLQYVEIIKRDFEAKGYELKITYFDDSIQPNTALAEGTIDANFYQHVPFLKSYNEKNKTDLVMLEPHILTSVFGVFSDKYKDIADLPEKAVITVSTDASNKDRSLRMLRDNGMITLKDKADNKLYTLLDIKDNPHNYQFVEIDLYQLISSIGTADAAIFNSLLLSKSGQYDKHPLIVSADNVNFPLGVVVLGKNKDAKWARDTVEIFSSANSKAYLEKVFKGAVTPLF